MIKFTSSCRHESRLEFGPKPQMQSHEASERNELQQITSFTPERHILPNQRLWCNPVPHPGRFQHTVEPTGSCRPEAKNKQMSQWQTQPLTGKDIPDFGRLKLRLCSSDTHTHGYSSLSGRVAGHLNPKMFTPTAAGRAFSSPLSEFMPLHLKQHPRKIIKALGLWMLIKIYWHHYIEPFFIFLIFLVLFCNRWLISFEKLLVIISLINPCSPLTGWLRRLLCVCVCVFGVSRCCSQTYWRPDSQTRGNKLRLYLSSYLVSEPEFFTLFSIILFHWCTCGTSLSLPETAFWDNLTSVSWCISDINKAYRWG